MSLAQDIQTKSTAAQAALTGLIAVVRTAEARLAEIPNETAAAAKKHEGVLAELEQKERVAQAALELATAKADELDKASKKHLEEAKASRLQADGLLDRAQKLERDWTAKNAQVNKGQTELDIKTKLVDEKLKRLDEVKASL